MVGKNRLSDKIVAFGGLGLNRGSWVKLPHQVADALRLAIAGGAWTPGERLPSTRDIASELGVSRRVATDAMRILAKEGRVSLREKSGAVVNDVRVATLATRSGLRTFRTTLSRVEYDMLAMSEVVADALLDYLRTGVFPEGVSVCPAWRVGGSFP